MQTKITYWDILAALALAILLSLTQSCAPRVKTIVIEDGMTYELPRARETPTVANGWKGWI